ncbi:hypothetical protein C2E23DRAFT_862680 [Lenzites betulinus]|nr:hypothetical protein C2E23DRAFT_862680 [Lenzites betulinus]
MAQVLPDVLLSGRRAHNSGTPGSFCARKGSLEPRYTHDSRSPCTHLRDAKRASYCPFCVALIALVVPILHMTTSDGVAFTSSKPQVANAARVEGAVQASVTTDQPAGGAISDMLRTELSGCASEKSSAQFPAEGLVASERESPKIRPAEGPAANRPDTPDDICPYELELASPPYGNAIPLPDFIDSIECLTFASFPQASSPRTPSQETVQSGTEEDDASPSSVQDNSQTPLKASPFLGTIEEILGITPVVGPENNLDRTHLSPSTPADARPVQPSPVKRKRPDSQAVSHRTKRSAISTDSHTETNGRVLRSRVVGKGQGRR